MFWRKKKEERYICFLSKRNGCDDCKKKSSCQRNGGSKKDLLVIKETILNYKEFLCGVDFIFSFEKKEDEIYFFLDLKEIVPSLEFGDPFVDSRFKGKNIKFLMIHEKVC